MKRFSVVAGRAALGLTAVRVSPLYPTRRLSATTADMTEEQRKQFEAEETTRKAEARDGDHEGKEEAGKASESSGKGTDSKSNALGAATEAPKKRNIVVLSNTTKAVYIHPTNHIASWYWFITDFHKWFVGFVFLFVGSQVLARFRLAKVNTAAQAQLGENLLDQRTRDLLSDIEVLRKKDPIRLEHEANMYHEQFWKRRAMAVSQSREELRKMEMEKGKMQGIARGTDMTEWLGAKAKDDEEREVARRTQDYIQGFHQHLKSKRLI